MLDQFIECYKLHLKPYRLAESAIAFLLVWGTIDHRNPSMASLHAQVLRSTLPRAQLAVRLSWQLDKLQQCYGLNLCSPVESGPMHRATNTLG